MTSSRSVASRGQQEPRLSLVPRSASNEADDAAFLATRYGLTPDDWQFSVLEGWLGLRADGRWSASRCGLAVPRQNGKNGVLEIVELFKMVVLGRRILHTAHEVKTARKAFLRLTSFFENERQFPELAALVKEIRRTNGQEAITLTNGASCEFIARSKGSGRGFTVDDLVCDEAQELSEDAMAALLPTISAAPSGNPQLTLTGTPPATNMAGDAWTKMRNRGVEGKDARLAWFEWSCEGAVDLDSPATWAQANPALGLRLQREVIEDERSAFDDDTFARERLGMWATDAITHVIDPALWRTLVSAEVASPEPVAYAVDMSPGQRTAAIGVAVPHGDGVRVEVAAHGDASHGSRWVTDWLIERRRNPVAVIIDAASPAASLVPALIEGKVKVTLTGPRDMANAFGGFIDAVRSGRLSHVDDPLLNIALAGASKRNIGTEGGEGWNRRNASTDITPLVAVTLAKHALETNRPRKAGGRKVVVLS